MLLGSKPVVDLFNDDDDDDGDDADIFKQMSSRASAENPVSSTDKHKVMKLDVCVSVATWVVWWLASHTGGFELHQ